jgi:hypothetical protein
MGRQLRWERHEPRECQRRARLGPCLGVRRRLRVVRSPFFQRSGERGTAGNRLKGLVLVIGWFGCGLSVRHRAIADGASLPIVGTRLADLARRGAGVGDGLFGSGATRHAGSVVGRRKFAIVQVDELLELRDWPGCTH